MKTLRLFSIIATAMAAITIQAQTVNVNVGQVKYAHTASQVGDMQFADGTTLTIQNKTYTISDINNIVVDDSSVDDNTISVTYNGSTAQVVVAGNVAQYVDVTVNGAHVCVMQDTLSTEVINFTLTGTSTDGSFYMDGEAQANFELNNLTLTNPDSCAIRIEDGKKLGMTLVGANTLTDGAGGTHKSTLNINGHSVWTGSGTLTLTGNTNHAFFADEYVNFDTTFTGSFTVTDAVNDGFHINQYFKMQSGTVTINAQGDGVDVGVTGKSKGSEGQFIMSGGTLDVTSTGTAAKGIKCDSTMTISGGTITSVTSGDGTFDETENDTKSSAAIKPGYNLVISGGTITAKSSGSGGKGINAGNLIDISGGTVTVVTTGAVYEYSSTLDSKPAGIKSGGNMTLSGGTVLSCASASKGTAFKSDGYVLFNGGTHMGIGGKATTASSLSTQGFVNHIGVTATGGTTLTLSGVSFDIPSDYSASGVYVIVSSADL